jgi:hypothetical protein
MRPRQENAFLGFEPLERKRRERPCDARDEIGCLFLRPVRVEHGHTVLDHPVRLIRRTSEREEGKVFDQMRDSVGGERFVRSAHPEHEDRRERGRSFHPERPDAVDFGALRIDPQRVHLRARRLTRRA